MRFRNTLFGIIQIPFHKKRLIGLICLITMFLSATALAGDDVQRTDAEDTRELIKRAEKLTKKGEVAEAEKILRRVLKINAKEPRVKLSLAYVLLKQKKLAESYLLAFEVAKADPKNSYAFAILGGTLLGSGEFENAKLAFNNSLYLNKRESLAWAGLGMLDFYENRITDSLNALREAVYYDPNEPDFIFALGQVSARAEKYKEAATAYRRFLQIALQNDIERRDRIKGLIKFLEFLGNRQSLYEIDGADQTTVPIDLVGNRPVIKLKINKNDEPLNFVLDTGSGISVISKETAKKLKIKPITRGGLARALGGSGKFEIVYGFINSVYIGDVKVKNVPVYIREFHNSGQPVDGYIGISLISKFLTTVDYGELKFSLMRKRLAEKRVVDTEVLSLPLRLTSSGFLSGKVQLEGVENPLNFIVDTGASISVISDDLANSKEISPFLADEKMRVIGAAGITEDVSSFMLPRVTFGSHSRSKIKAVALDLDIINEASGFQQAGILGGNFLKDYSLTFDFENSKVIFVPNKK
jgi:tetratricopeptide (TPR) repeat protein